jgi:hypothetical protein
MKMIIHNLLKNFASSNFINVVIANWMPFTCCSSMNVIVHSSSHSVFMKYCLFCGVCQGLQFIVNKRSTICFCTFFHGQKRRLATYWTRFWNYPLLIPYLQRTTFHICPWILLSCLCIWDFQIMLGRGGGGGGDTK